jgi:hypothetical protein
MSVPPLSSDDRVLQAHLLQAAGDVSPAAAIVARATAQGRRSLRRRRVMWTTGAGASVAVVAALAVSGTWGSDSVTQPIAPAGPGTVHTVPDQRPAPVRDTEFVVDPQVQRAASEAINAAVAAALPGLPPAQADPTQIPDVPLSTGQRGWTWSSTDETTMPGTTVFLTVDQYKKQPIPAVSICQGQEWVTCTDEVLPDGTHLVSGTGRGTFDQDGVESDMTLPSATATLPDGREIRAMATLTGPPQAGTTYPADAKVTAEALRA